LRHHVNALGLAALAALAAPARAGTPAPGFSDSLVVGGLQAPTASAFLPNGMLLITEKGGSLKLFDGSSATTLVTVPVCTTSEMGLLGVAVDPSFSSNGFIYLYRTKAGAGGCATPTDRFNQVVRVTLSGGAVNPASLTELLSGIRTDNGNHDGGVLRIGPGSATTSAAPARRRIRMPRTLGRSMARFCASTSTARRLPTTPSSVWPTRAARSGPSGSATRSA